MTETVTRAYLADAIHRKMGLPTVECSAIVDDVFDEIVDTLANKENVKLSSFGTFRVNHKKARVGRNPKTKEEAIISARYVVTFHASNILKERMNRAFANS